METSHGEGVAREREGRALGLWDRWASACPWWQAGTPPFRLPRGSRVQGTLPRPCRQGAAPSTWFEPPQPPTSPLGRLPCPPAARLMSWLRGGLMGMSEQPPAPPGDSGGRRGGQDKTPQREGLWRQPGPGRVSRGVGSVGGEAERLCSFPRGVHWAPPPGLGPMPPQLLSANAAGLPASVPSWGPAYLGTGQRPHSTGRRWRRSRSAGRPRLGCRPRGGHLGRGEGSDCGGGWDGVCKGFPENRAVGGA